MAPYTQWNKRLKRHGEYVDWKSTYRFRMCLRNVDVSMCLFFYFWLDDLYRKNQLNRTKWIAINCVHPLKIHWQEIFPSFQFPFFFVSLSLCLLKNLIIRKIRRPCISLITHNITRTPYHNTYTFSMSRNTFTLSTSNKPYCIHFVSNLTLKKIIK